MVWSDYYKGRVGKSYVNYFMKQYSTFLQKIVDNLSFCKGITEVGCGIGTASICLMKQNVINSLTLVDRCNSMLNLTYQNIQINNLNIPKLKRGYIPSYLPKTDCISHGVLEHLNKSTIKSYMLKLRKEKISSVHYVPTNKYEYKSFGDENLWSVDEWIDLTNPKEIALFNNDKDLVLVC
jgi:hypothetical protein